ncbi:MAG: phosphopentomutase [Firmicutes bacterium]|nr:phosphopentomutase [Bacillota bacterium]
MKRFIVVVLDSAGIGEAPDAALFGDAGSSTMGHIAEGYDLQVPQMQRLGLGNIAPLRGVPAADAPQGAYGKMTPLSMGKDTTTGHWEMAGIIMEQAMPTFPNGFPKELLDEFSRRTGRGVLGNKVASGVAIINELGDQMVATGDLIVYTSADSVFQIAAHEEVVPVDELYRICEIARELLAGPYGVGRVIARPFIGTSGAYKRTENRRDFSLIPPPENLLHRLQQQGVPVVSVGKIRDIFAGKYIDEALPAHNNDESIDQLIAALKADQPAFIFVNLVDFDMLYGHRNDVSGYGRALDHFDERLPEILQHLGEEDLLVITADHGNDPSTPSTDHSREYVPLLVYGAGINHTDLGVRGTFADLGATVAEYFGTDLAVGESFLPQLMQKG